MSKNPIISLSTSYLQTRFGSHGYEMLYKAAEMGFEYVELGHSTPVSAIEGIEKAVKEGVVKVSSTHNFCPVPPFTKGSAPNLFSPATKSKSESQLWLRHTRNTLEFAARFGALAVVCHCGNLSYFFVKPGSKISKFAKAHKDDDILKMPEYIYLVDTYKASSKGHSQECDYLNIEKNIRLVSDFASEKKILIGIENRDGIDELPLDWNFEMLVNRLKKSTPARAWHDVGHSMKKELIGLGSQTDLLERTVDSLAGWHLHDCTEDGKDHTAIGKGCIDFKKLKKFFDPKHHIFTLELNKSVRSAEATDSLKRVQDMMQ